MATCMISGDDEMLVDKLVVASQKKGETALKSFGRNLVPYFVPGADNCSEADINVNTDVDTIRRNGGSFLEAPVPVAQGFQGEELGSISKKNQTGRKQKKRKNLKTGFVNVSPAKHVQVSTSHSHITLMRRGALEERQDATEPYSGGPHSPDRSEKWAGPAYYNSPPPSSLPMPRFPLVPANKSAACSESLTKVARSAPPSPLKNASFHATKALHRMLNLEI